jgi:hypothetical protein
MQIGVVAAKQLAVADAVSDSLREAVANRIASLTAPGLIAQAKYLFEGPAVGVAVGPARQIRGDRVQVVDAAVDVRGDERIADGLQGELGAVLLLFEPALDAPSCRNLMLQLPVDLEGLVPGHRHRLGQLRIGSREVQRPSEVVVQPLGGERHDAKQEYPEQTDQGVQAAALEHEPAGDGQQREHGKGQIRGEYGAQDGHRPGGYASDHEGDEVVMGDGVAVGQEKNGAAPGQTGQAAAQAVPEAPTSWRNRRLPVALVGVYQRQSQGVEDQMPEEPADDQRGGGSTQLGVCRDAGDYQGAENTQGGLFIEQPNPFIEDLYLAVAGGYCARMHPGWGVTAGVLRRFGCRSHTHYPDESPSGPGPSGITPAVATRALGRTGRPAGRWHAHPARWGRPALEYASTPL